MVSNLSEFYKVGLVALRSLIAVCLPAFRVFPVKVKTIKVML